MTGPLDRGKTHKAGRILTMEKECWSIRVSPLASKVSSRPCGSNSCETESRTTNMCSC
jgi:hypothetical protein